MKGQYKGLGKHGLERDDLPVTGSPERVVVSISMSRSDLAMLDERARNHKVERSSFVRRLIRDGWLSTCSVCRKPTSSCTCGAPRPTTTEIKL